MRKDEIGQTVHKENYMKRNNIGEDLFLKKQVIINTETDEWLSLAFRSNVFYKLFLLNGNVYHPKRFVKIKVFDCV